MEDEQTARTLAQLVADSRAARQRAVALVERAEEAMRRAALATERHPRVYADVLPHPPTSD